MSQPVLIAGGGPVGLMLACELGLAGVDTIVLERQDQPSEQSRGMVINAAVVELLAQRGVMDRLRNDGIEFPRAHFAHLWLDPARLPDKHPFAFGVPHSQIERRLEERARELGVDVRRGTEIVSVEQDDDGVVVGVRTGEPVRGRYLVGCDGGESTVRALAGFGFPGTDLAFRGILGDVEVESDDPLFALLGAHQHDRGLFAVGPISPNVVRVMTGEFDVDPVGDTVPVTHEELSESFERITGTKLTGGPTRWLSRWNAPTRQAETYRIGRVFLAGDAAHLFFPLGGQALSTGMEDAVNLGWKLAAEINGWAPAGLLDSYHDERHPVGARACLTTRAQVAIMHPMARIQPLRDIIAELSRFDEVNEYFVKMVGGIDVRYPISYPEMDPATAHPLLGRRLPQVAVMTEAGETPLDRLLHTGRGLFLEFADGARDSELSGWADRVDLVTAKTTPEIDATALLLRPDGRVAWADTAGAGSTHLRTALRTWFGEPARTPAL
jgi:2-polyprenyl-6-methoxyphenol hydroxylase-like FAD-dependent oxidoreductase